jgi:hypothetical protein
MKLYDTIVKLMGGAEKERYVYLSKNKANMKGLNVHVSESVDLSKAQVTVFVVHPIGVAGIPGTVRGVFADRGSTTEDHIRRFLTLSDNAFIAWVNPETLELIDDTNGSPEPSESDSVQT